jgi:hypothetical protein
VFGDPGCSAVSGVADVEDEADAINVVDADGGGTTEVLAQAGDEDVEASAQEIVVVENMLRQLISEGD